MSTHCVVLYDPAERLVLNTLTSTAGVLDYLQENNFIPTTSGNANGLV